MPARIRMMPTSISSPSKPACRPATSVPTAVSKYANKNSTDALFPIWKQSIRLIDFFIIFVA